MSTIALHHILVKSPLLADDIMRELKLGAEFGDLAAEYSVCLSARNQGFAGYHNTDNLPIELVTALFGKSETAFDVSSPYLGPIRTELGYHIVKTTDKPTRSMVIDE